MTTYRLPSELKRDLESALPRRQGATLSVRVIPRDRAERRCSAYEADHYEVRAFYTMTDADALDLLEKALADIPGVYLTTQLSRGVRDRNMVTNPVWPAALGQRRRDFHSLRPQVLALVRD